MSYCIFTYLGETNNYEEKFYCLDNKKVNNEKDKFYIKYLNNGNLKISKIYLFTTEEIIKDKENLESFFNHFDIKEEEIRKYLGRRILDNLEFIENIFEKKTNIKLSIKVKKETLGEEDLKELVDIIKKEENLLFDITHSYRDIPLFYLSLLNLIISANDIEINTEFLYVRETDKEKAKIEILKDFKEFQEWSYAIYIMKKSFNLVPLAELIEKLSVEFKSLSDNLKNIHLYFNINALKLLEREVKKLKENLDKTKDKLPLPYKLVESDMKEFLNKFTKENFKEFQKEIWKFSFDNEIYDKAILALREYIISEIVSVYYEDIKNEKNRKNVETILFCKKFIEKHVNEDIKELLSNISNIRNQIAHLKGFDKIEKKTKNFIQDANLKEIEHQINVLKSFFKEKIPNKKELEKKVKELNKNWESMCK